MGTDVRIVSGVPVAANFALQGSSPPCSPIIINSLTGIAYYLGANDAVTRVATDISSDGSVGINTTITTALLVGKTITVKDGLITAFA